MWHCPKCGAEVLDAVPSCWRCGELRGGAARFGLPEPADQFFAFSRLLGDDRFRPPYRVSRRFGIGRLMCLTAFVAVLCAVFSLLAIHPVFYVVAFGFIMIVGLAQVFAYSGHRPRRASIVAGGGVALLAVIPGLAVLASLLVLRPGTLEFEFLLPIIKTELFFIAASAITGYLAGWVVVGILLGREIVPDAEPSVEAPDRADGPDAG